MSEVVFVDSSVLYNLLDIPHKNGERDDAVAELKRLTRQKATLIDLMGTSQFGHAPMEGAVLRRGVAERCKVVRPDFVRATDQEIARTRNRVARTMEA